MSISHLLRILPCALLTAAALLFAAPHAAAAAPAAPTAHLAGITSGAAAEEDDSGKGKKADEDDMKSKRAKKSKRARSESEEDEDEDENDEDEDDEDEGEDDKKAKSRIARIMNCAEAKGRHDLALSIALESNVSVKTARRLLAAAPKANALDERMAGTRQPTLGPGSDGGKPSAAAIQASWERAFAAVVPITRATPGARVPATR